MNAVLSHTNVVTSSSSEETVWSGSSLFGCMGWYSSRVPWFFLSVLIWQLVSVLACQHCLSLVLIPKSLSCAHCHNTACSVRIRLELCFASFLPAGPSLRWSLFHLDFYPPAHSRFLSAHAYLTIAAWLWSKARSTLIFRPKLKLFVLAKS